MRELFFYERDRNKAALRAQLASPSWQAMVAHWPECFEGTEPADGGPFIRLVRIGGFAREGAIPIKSAD